jgi:putative transposase
VVRERRSFAAGRGVTSDQTILLASRESRKECPIPLRRVGYRDPETGRHYKFLTNNFRFAPKTIADIYKARWEIELFFKWIKQNLRIKSFLGTSRNAVMTQIWIAMCVYLLLSYLKFSNRMKWTLSEILRLLHMNLLERRSLRDLLLTEHSWPPTENRQLTLVTR